jgi:UDP-N-acetyl-D-glucosamine dehydrogenase
VGRIADILNQRGLPLFGTEILGIGIAYKPGIADDRESASLEVLRELARRGGRVSVLDPVVGEERVTQHGFDNVDISDDLSRFQLAAVLTDHPSIDYADLASRVPVVYDARGVYRRLGLRFENVQAL